MWFLVRRWRDTNWGDFAVMVHGRLSRPDRRFGRLRHVTFLFVEIFPLPLRRLWGPTKHPDWSRNRTGDQQIRFSHLNQYDGYVMTLIMIFRVYIWKLPGHGVSRKFGPVPQPLFTKLPQPLFTMLPQPMYKRWPQPLFTKLPHPMYKSQKMPQPDELHCPPVFGTSEFVYP